MLKTCWNYIKYRELTTNYRSIIGSYGARGLPNKNEAQNQSLENVQQKQYKKHSLELVYIYETFQQQHCMQTAGYIYIAELDTQNECYGCSASQKKDSFRRQRRRSSHRIGGQNPCHASCFVWVFLKQMVELICLFKKDRGKTASRARGIVHPFVKKRLRQNSQRGKDSVPQSDVTTFALSSK